MLWSQYKSATIRRSEFLRKQITWILNIANLDSDFLTLQTSELKKNLTGIFGIKNGTGILLTMGVPEIGTKNQNSQPRGGINVGRDTNTIPVVFVRLLVNTPSLTFNCWHFRSHDRTGEDVEFTFCWWLFYWNELLLVQFGLVKNVSGGQHSFRKWLLPDNEIPSGSVWEIQRIFIWIHTYEFIHHIFIHMNSYIKWIHSYLLCQQ